MSLRGGRVSPPSVNRLLGFLVDTPDLTNEDALVFGAEDKKWFPRQLSYSQLGFIKAGTSSESTLTLSLPEIPLENYSELKLIISGGITGGKVSDTLSFDTNISETSIYAFIRQVLIHLTSGNTTSIEDEEDAETIDFDYGTLFNQGSIEQLIFYLELDINTVHGTSSSVATAGIINFQITNPSTKETYSVSFNYIDSNVIETLDNITISLNGTQTFSELTTMTLYGLTLIT